MRRSPTELGLLCCSFSKSPKAIFPRFTPFKKHKVTPVCPFMFFKWLQNPQQRRPSSVGSWDAMQHFKLFILFSVLFFNFFQIDAFAADKRILLKHAAFGEYRKKVPQRVWSDMEKLASNLSISRSDLRKKASISGFLNNKGILVFSNTAHAPECSRDYLIQRVHLHKVEKYQKKLFEKDTYLVEAFKLNKKKWLKRPDWHWKRYPIRKADEREIKVEYEIGCGEVLRIAEGQTWPFSPKYLYEKISDYSSSRKVFDSAKFEFSHKYSLLIKIKKSGEFTANLKNFYRK